VVAWEAVRSQIKAPFVVPRAIQLATQTTVVGALTIQNPLVTLSLLTLTTSIREVVA